MKWVIALSIVGLIVLIFVIACQPTPEIQTIKPIQNKYLMVYVQSGVPSFMQTVPASECQIKGNMVVIYGSGEAWGGSIAYVPLRNVSGILDLKPR